MMRRRRLMAMLMEEEYFVPDTFTQGWVAGTERVELGGTIQTTYTLSYKNGTEKVKADGLYVSVFDSTGTQIETEKKLKATNEKAVERGKSNIYKFNYSMFTNSDTDIIQTCGIYRFEAVAKDIDGNCSKPLIRYVEVYDSSETEVN